MRPHSKLSRVLAGAASVMMAVGLPTPSHALVLDETFTLSTDAAPGGTGRINRNAVASACGTAKPFPGTIAGNFHSNTRSLVNNGPAQCVTITIASNDCSDGDADVFPALYTASFDPNNLSANYLGDAGTSTGSPTSPPVSFGVDLTAGQTVTLVVESVDAVGAGAICHYTVYSPQLDDPLEPAIPTLGSWALAALGTLFAATGALIVLRRRRLGA